jgi:phosphoglycolate phosphatase
MTSWTRKAAQSAPAAILFDLDGTLIDSAPDIAFAVNAVLEADGLAPLGLDAVRGMIGHGLEKLVERAFAARGADLDPQALRQRHAVVHAVYAGHLVELTALRPGARAAVQAVQELGLRSAVVTNKPEGLSRRILDQFGLLADLDLVIGGDSGYPRKPAPDMLLAACAQLGASPCETVLIGDSRADLASARAAGTGCILVRGGYCDRPADELGADLVIDELDAVPALLRACEAVP